jgi:nucleotide-binding universal stress UspA family protein
MKILVGYDGSSSSKEALRLAKIHARAFGASVEVATSMFKGSEDEQEQIRKAEKGLEYTQSVFQSDDIDCNTHLLIRGLAAGEDLVQFAQEQGADEIIIGVKRRSKVGKLMFGSTAQYVILNAGCPVVSVK